MVDSDLAKKNSLLLIGGGACILGGCFFCFMGLISMTPLTIILGGAMIVGGIGLIIYAVSSGLKFSLGANEKQPEERHDGAYIMTKLIVDKKGETVFDADMHDPETLQYLVQVHFATGRKSEFRTSPIVFDSMGEGQKGLIVIQGRWINQFIFKPEMTGRDERTFDAPYRPGT